MFDDFFYDFLNFDRDYYRFCHLLDQNPYKIVRKDNSVIIIHNCVGVSPEDIHVKVENKDGNSYLTITGETHDEIGDMDYNINSRFSFDESKYEKIEYESKNGLLYITLLSKKPTESQIKIEKK